MCGRKVNNISFILTASPLPLKRSLRTNVFMNCKSGALGVGPGVIRLKIFQKQILFISFYWIYPTQVLKKNMSVQYSHPSWRKRSGRVPLEFGPLSCWISQAHLSSLKYTTDHPIYTWYVCLICTRYCGRHHDISFRGVEYN